MNATGDALGRDGSDPDPFALKQRSVPEEKS
jgi:hypothetical protein